MADVIADQVGAGRPGGKLEAQPSPLGREGEPDPQQVPLGVAAIELNRNHRGSDRNVNRGLVKGLRPGFSGTPEGVQGGVAAGDAADQLLGRCGAPEPLQVAHQGQGAISLPAPADPETTGQLGLKHHGFPLIGEAPQDSTPHHRQVEFLKRRHQQGFVPQNRWQDGEMGHGPTPAFPDPSELERAVQWPLPPVVPFAAPSPLRLGVMASGAGSNFQALVEACEAGSLRARVELLVVNNPDCGAQHRAQQLGVPWQVLDHRGFASREALDQALAGAFRGAEVDLVVMAGWMRIVTAELIHAFPDRLINIHPSLLPSFRGARAVEQALTAGVTLTGCTAHLVRLEVDSGPILVQAAVPVAPGDTCETLTARIHHQEHRILPLAVQLAAQRLGLLQPA